MTVPSVTADLLDLGGSRARLTAATSGPWARGHDELADQVRSVLNNAL